MDSIISARITQLLFHVEFLCDIERQTPADLESIRK